MRRLAGFGTRHTLSSQTDPVRGIGAARDWIFDTLQGYAAASGGRMTVEKQSFVQPAGSPRIPVDTVITNVIATLRGDTDPERVYVVSGHYDSRVTDVLNATSTTRPAPTTTHRAWRWRWSLPGSWRPGTPRPRWSSPPSRARSRTCTAPRTWPG